MAFVVLAYCVARASATIVLTIQDKQAIIFHENTHIFWCFDNQLRKTRIRAHFLSLARCKLRLCSANHMLGYWSNKPFDWPSTACAYSEQETALLVHKFRRSPYNSPPALPVWYGGGRRSCQPHHGEFCSCWSVTVWQQLVNGAQYIN